MLCVCSCRRGSMCRPGQGAVAEGAGVETRSTCAALEGKSAGRPRTGAHWQKHAKQGYIEGDARAKAQQRRKAAHVRVDCQAARGPRPQRRTTVGTNPFSDKVLKRSIHSLRSNWLKRQRSERSALFPLALARLSSPAPHSRTVRARVFMFVFVSLLSSTKIK